MSHAEDMKAIARFCKSGLISDLRSLKPFTQDVIKAYSYQDGTGNALKYKVYNHYTAEECKNRKLDIIGQLHDYNLKIGESGLECYSADGLLYSEGLTMEFFEKHPDWEWDASTLSGSPDLPLELVEKHPGWDWDTKALSGNRFLTMEFLEKHQDWDWDMSMLSSNIPDRLN